MMHTQIDGKQTRNLGTLGNRSMAPPLFRLHYSGSAHGVSMDASFRRGAERRSIGELLERAKAWGLEAQSTGVWV